MSSLNTVRRQVRVVMEEKRLKMATDIDEEVSRLQLLGDPARIMQILSNFAWNACKFTLEGSVTFAVAFVPESRLSGGSQHKRGTKLVEFSVIDTGPGIPKSVQDNLFQPFVQGDKSTTRHHGGTGLGLSICRQLAKLMGGDVRCASEVGRGSSFILSLPIAAADAAPVPASMPADVPQKSLGNQLGNQVPLPESLPSLPLQGNQAPRARQGAVEMQELRSKLETLRSQPKSGFSGMVNQNEDKAQDSLRSQKTLGGSQASSVVGSLKHGILASIEVC